MSSLLKLLHNPAQTRPTTSRNLSRNPSRRKPSCYTAPPILSQPLVTPSQTLTAVQSVHSVDPLQYEVDGSYKHWSA